MQLKKILTAVLGLLSFGLTAYTSRPQINDTSSNLHCDDNCVHRILFRSGYVSACEGFKMVMASCNTIGWCVNEAKDWCPDAINSTLTRVASQAKIDTTAEVDYNNINNITLLSAMSTVSARSTRIAISLALSLMKHGIQSCDADRVMNLAKIRGLMVQYERPVQYNADRFEEIVSNRLLGGAAYACKFDFVLCTKIKNLSRLLKAAREVLPKLNPLRCIFEGYADDASWSSVDEPKFAKEWLRHGGEKRIEQWLEEVGDGPWDPVREDVLPQPDDPDYPYYPPNPSDTLVPDKLFFNPLEGVVDILHSDSEDHGDHNEVEGEEEHKDESDGGGQPGDGKEAD